MEVICTPEGHAMITHCPSCGAREETFAKLRDLGDLPAVFFIPADEALRSAEDFADAHQCPTGGPPEDQSVRAMVQDLLDGAKRSLAHGNHIPPRLHLLTSGGVLLFSLEDVYGTQDPDRRRITLAGEKWRARREVERRGLILKAAVATYESEEAGLLDLSSERQEALTLVVSTANYSYGRIYPIHQDIGMQKVGIVTLGKADGNRIGKGRMLDGLFIGPTN